MPPYLEIAPRILTASDSFPQTYCWVRCCFHVSSNELKINFCGNFFWNGLPLTDSSVEMSSTVRRASSCMVFVSTFKIFRLCNDVVSSTTPTLLPPKASTLSTQNKFSACLNVQLSAA